MKQQFNKTPTTTTTTKKIINKQKKTKPKDCYNIGLTIFVIDLLPVIHIYNRSILVKSLGLFPMYFVFTHLIKIESKLFFHPSSIQQLNRNHNVSDINAVHL